ncbi:hypothetical protein B0H14DRAFT_2628325 [Mycena olivaceomarginata]|nr:hypothetical protein B0H14DRAFT_2628325 [Mycena olivaceomarginata]
MRGFFKKAPSKVPPVMPTLPLIRPFVPALASPPDSPRAFSARDDTSSSFVGETSINSRAPSPSNSRSSSPALVETSVDSIAPEEPVQFICKGIQLTFPAGENQHTSYPFGLHAKFPLPICLTRELGA